MKTADIKVGTEYAVGNRASTGGRRDYRLDMFATKATVLATRQPLQSRSSRNKQDIGVLVRYYHGLEKVVHPGRVISDWESYAAEKAEVEAYRARVREANDNDKQRVFDAQTRLAELGVCRAPGDRAHDRALRFGPKELEAILALIDGE